MKKLTVTFALAVFATAVMGTLAHARGNGNSLPTGVVYVKSQGLYYDMLVPADLDGKGRYQKLEGGGPHGGPQTEYGIGDVGYLGVRWWQDLNNNNIQDDGDNFFLCPLLGPGRVAP